MIEYAVQKSDTVYVYGDGNQRLFMLSGELQGYTSTTVSVKKGNTLYVYNDKGSTIAMH